MSQLIARIETTGLNGDQITKAHPLQTVNSKRRRMQPQNFRIHGWKGRNGIYKWYATSEIKIELEKKDPNISITIKFNENEYDNKKTTSLILSAKTYVRIEKIRLATKLLKLTHGKL